MSRVPNSEKVLFKAKWIQLMSCDYEVTHPQTGEQVVKTGWEYVDRTTHTLEEVNAAVIIPLLKYADGRKQ